MKSLTFLIDFIDFLIIKLNIFDCLLKLWSLKLKFDQKIKVWLFGVQLTFSSVDQISTINQLILRNELNHEIRSRWCIWILDIMFKANKSCIRSKVKNQAFSVKTLILTILPLWWSDQISWGIVIQTWTNGSYEFKMLLWINNHEV